MQGKEVDPFRGFLGKGKEGREWGACVCSAPVGAGTMVGGRRPVGSWRGPGLVRLGFAQFFLKIEKEN